MAKKGEAGRALSAAYMSSLMGGVFGALLMAISIFRSCGPVMLFPGLAGNCSPFFRPRHFDGCDFLSGNAPLRGPHGGLYRHHDRDDRDRSAVGNAALGRSTASISGTACR